MFWATMPTATNAVEAAATTTAANAPTTWRLWSRGIEWSVIDQARGAQADDHTDVQHEDRGDEHRQAEQVERHRHRSQGQDHQSDTAGEAPPRVCALLCEPRPDPGHAVPQVATVVPRSEGEDQAEDEEQLAGADQTPDQHAR